MINSRLYAILDVAFHDVPTYKLAIFSVFSVAFSWITFLDIALRVVGLAISLIVGWYAVQNYRYDIQIKKRKLAEDERKEKEELQKQNA
jgi:hypothetical protein